MGKAIGIDLGTTNSVMAQKVRDLRIIQNQENEDTTRSAVGSYKTQIYVGTPAMNYMPQAPKDTIISIKRLMGRDFNDPEVQKAKEKKNFIFYDIVPAEDGAEGVRVVMAGKKYSPVEISSRILAKLKRDAENRLGGEEPVDQAVITVPAYFTERQRYATREAGWKAGLKVQQILAEPTAAAIAYGVNNLAPEDAQTILVYDFGGGTLDISVLQVVGSIFAELNIEGNMWLGGDDFDEQIVKYAEGKIKEDYGIDLDHDPIPPDEKDKFRLALRREAERAKIMLSSAPRAHLLLSNMLKDAEGNLIDVEVEITRGEFERLIEGQVRDSLELVKRALENAQVTKEQIDKVLLVGGSTSVPLVQRTLTEFFGEAKILRDLDPMKCVAQGAAIMAGVLGDRVECPDCGRQNDKGAVNCGHCGIEFPILGGNVTGLPYGIQLAGDEFSTIIPKNFTYPNPQPKKETFYTRRDNQRRLKVPVYCGDNGKASQNELQRSVWMLLPPSLPAGTPVEVALGLSEDGILDLIRVKLLDGSGRQVEIFNATEGAGDRAQLEKRIEEARQKWEEKLDKADHSTVWEAEQLYDEVIAAVGEGKMELAQQRLGKFEQLIATVGVKEWQRRGNNIIGYAEEMVERYGRLMDGDDSYQVKKLIEETKAAIQADKEELGQQKYQELDKKLDGCGLANILTFLRMRIWQAKNLGMPREADQLAAMVSKAEAAAFAGEMNTVTSELEKAVPIAKAIGEKMGEKPQKDKDGDYLEKDKGRTPTR